VLGGFPGPVRADLGFSLWQLQQGEQPASAARRMDSIGPGVLELKEQDERTWYRVIYLARIEDKIHVLHCFEKRSRKTGVIWRLRVRDSHGFVSEYRDSGGIKRTWQEKPIGRVTSPRLMFLMI